MKNLLAILALLGATVCGAGLSEQWAKAFSGDKVESLGGSNFEIYYFETCKVPGPGEAIVKEEPKKDAQKDSKKDSAVSEAAIGDPEDIFDDSFDIFGDDEEVSPEALERLKETLAFLEKQLEAAEKRVAGMPEDVDETSAMYAEDEKAKAQSQVNSVKAEIADMEKKLERKEKKAKPAAAVEDKKEAKAEEKTEAKDKESAVAEKKTAAKGKKSAAAGKAKAAAKETHDEPTKKYYKLDEVYSAAVQAFNEIQNSLLSGSSIDWGTVPGKVYVVTNPKMWQALKGKGSHLTPARNAVYDSEKRAFLIYASPALKDVLGKTLGYVVAQEVLDEYLKLKNPGGALCTAFRVGLCARAAKLDCVVDPAKIHDAPYLMENKLLLPSELFSLDKADDPMRCLSFTRQSSCLVGHLLEKHNHNFKEYIDQAKGGNSGFRTSFQFLEISPVWAGSYDEFCENLNRRVFFPLTKEAKTVPGALDAWNQSCADEDAEFKETKAGVQERQAKAREKSERLRRWRGHYSY